MYISQSRGNPDCLNGQANDECRSAPFAVAAGLHRPTVMFYDMFDDRKGPVLAHRAFAEIENLVARGWAFASDAGDLVVAIEMVLVRPVA